MVAANRKNKNWQRGRVSSGRPGSNLPRAPADQIPKWCNDLPEKWRDNISLCRTKTTSVPPQPTTTTQPSPPQDTPSPPAPPPPPPTTPPPPPAPSTEKPPEVPPTHLPSDKPPSGGGDDNTSIATQSVPNNGNESTTGDSESPTSTPSGGNGNGATLTLAPNNGSPSGQSTTRSATSTTVVVTTPSDGGTPFTTTIYFYPPAPSDPSGGEGFPKLDQNNNGNPNTVGAASQANRTGAIVGGILGALAFICLCAIAFVVYRRRTRRSRLPPSAAFLQRYGNSSVYRNQPTSPSPDMEQVPAYTPGPFDFPFRDKS